MQGSSVSDTELVDRERGLSATSTESLALGWSPLVGLLRPWHWIKNLFVFAPLIFAGSVLQPGAPLDALVAGLLFSIAASAVYVWNDIRDVEADRRHPVKRQTRPLAAGGVTEAQAYLVLAVLLTSLAAAGLATLPGLVGLVDPLVLLPIGAYLAINLAYTLGLKQVAVVDVVSIASGFVLRVYAGALAIGVTVSPWMLATTMALALYLALTKRRREQERYGATARSSLATYPAGSLKPAADLAALTAITAYALYTITTRPVLVITVPLVVYGFLRYRSLVERQGKGEAPVDVLLGDRLLALTVTAWLGLATLATWGIGA